MKRNIHLYFALCSLIGAIVLSVVIIALILSTPTEQTSLEEQTQSQTFGEYTSSIFSAPNSSNTESNTPKQSEEYTSSVYSYIDNSSQSTISIPSPLEVLESATSSNNTPSTSSFQTSTVVSMPATPSGEEIDEADKAEFIRLYNEAEQEYTDYITTTTISTYEQQIDNLKDTLSNYSSEMLRKKQVLAEQVAEMGMANSGYHKQKLKEIEDDYKIKQTECQEKIDELNKKIEETKQQQSSPNPYTVMGIIVENTDMSYDEVATKYIKYMQ